MSSPSEPPATSRRAFLAALAALPVLAACAPPVRRPSGTSGALKIGWSSDIDSLNPLTAETTEATEVLQLVYDRLFQYDLDLQPEPCLAERSAVTDDGRTVTYTLRTDVSWHDGQRFTAADVVSTFTLIHKYDISQYAPFLTDLTSVTAPDAATVVVRYKQAQAFDPGLCIPILPAHVWGSKSSTALQKFTNDHPVGTGPFRFGQWAEGQSVTLRRNESWWGTKPAAARVSWVVYSNDDVLAQALTAGDVDVLAQANPTVYDGLIDDPSITTVSTRSFSFHHIGINVSKSKKSKGNKLLLDRTVRQALACSISRAQLVALALAGHGEPGSSLLPAAFGDDHYVVPEADRLDDDPAKAKRLLDAGGYARRDKDGVRTDAKGNRLEFRLIAIEDTTVDVAAAQLAQIAARKVGIKLNLTTLDSNTLSDTVYNADPDWDVFVWGWDSEIADPDYLLSVPLTSQIGSNNDVFYSNPNYDALYTRQAATLDETTRRALVHEMQKLYYADCAYIVMWYQDKLQAHRDIWTGWKEPAGGMVFNFTRDNYLRVRPV